MSLYAYKRGFTSRYEVTHAISLQTADYYNDIGKMSLNVPIDAFNINALEVGGLLYDTDTGYTYIIANVKTDTKEHRITANGYTSNRLLNSRVIASAQRITSVEADLYAMIDANTRGLSYLSTAPVSGLEKTTNVELYGGQLMDAVQEILENAGYGNRMIWSDSAKSFAFQIYQGHDLTGGIHAVVFSEEQGTAEDLVINDDASIFKNVCYCAANYADQRTLLVEVGNASGNNRHEIWIQASGVTQDSAESDADFVARVQTFAAMQLGRYIRSQSFTVKVDASEFGALYDLGDLVSCSSVRFGVQFSARITGVKRKMDAHGASTEVVLGDPILTKIGEIRLG